jgi:hypothetical protein
MTAVVEDALDALERKVFFDTLNAGFAELRSDDAAWTAVEEERRLEEGAAQDRSR